MAMRITGMYSGLDTESIIQELVKAKSVKVETVKKDKTKLEWKQEAWNNINSKVKSLFGGKLSDLRFTSAYKKKTTSVSNSSAVSVITGDKAMNGVQTLSVDKLAKSGYMTGAVLKSKDGSAVTDGSTIGSLKFDKYAGLTASEGSFNVTVGDKTTKIDVSSSTSISEVVKQLNDAGVNASFDSANKRIFIASQESGASNDFALTANDMGGFAALSFLGINAKPTSGEESANYKAYSEYQKLSSFGTELESKLVYNNGDEAQGIDYSATMAGIDVGSDLYKAIKEGMTGDSDYAAGIDALKSRAEFANTVLNTFSGDTYYSDSNRIAGSDAEITLNGVKYTGNTNNIEVNGLTFTCQSVASDIVVTTQDDTEGIYDSIKSFIKEYNEIINLIDKSYNAKAAKDFEPLTDEEKEKMTDKEVEKWEDKIKEAILRKDTTLGTLSSTLKNGMSKGIEVNGKTMYLSNFGIETLSYFLAGENEKSMYHIDGDSDDEVSKSNADKLKTAIANEPETVITFFTELSRNLYSTLDKLSASTTSTSKGSFYEDKKYKLDLSDFESKIKEAEDKLAKYEDKYYARFSKMEVALSKLESSTSSITAMLGQ